MSSGRLVEREPGRRHRTSRPAARRAERVLRGGSETPLEQLLASDLTWTVPGDNRIAGTYHGLEEVFGYFRLRRDLADRTFRIKRVDVLVGDGDRIAALTDGFAMIGGADRHWSTVGLYEISEGRIAGCSLLPLDQRAFDAIWSR
jgi:hypothetical protein